MGKWVSTMACDAFLPSDYVRLTWPEEAVPKEEAVVKEASPKLDAVRKEALSVSPRPSGAADVADQCGLQLPWLQPPWLQTPRLQLPVLRCGEAEAEAEGDAQALPCM